MKLNFLFILPFIVSLQGSIVVSFAQKDYTNYYLNLKNTSEKPDSSMFFYQQAFLCNAPFPEDLINYSRICFTQGNMKESKKAMEDAIKVGFQYFPGLDENLHIIVDYTFFTLNYFVYSSYQTKKYLAFV